MAWLAGLAPNTCSIGLMLVPALRFPGSPQAQGDPSLILKLGTRDGFEVAFALNNRDAGSLGMTLVAMARTTGHRLRFAPTEVVALDHSKLGRSAASTANGSQNRSDPHEVRHSQPIMVIWS